MPRTEQTDGEHLHLIEASHKVPERKTKIGFEEVICSTTERVQSVLKEKICAMNL
jgi:hypothetical protein